MIRNALDHYPYSIFSCAALVLFFLLFIAAATLAYRADSKKIHGHAAKLPLEEE